MRTVLKMFITLGALLISANPLAAHAEEITLLNVSYDPTRELYQDFNVAFAKYWQKEKGQTVNIKQSHEGSSKH